MRQFNSKFGYRQNTKDSASSEHLNASPERFHQPFVFTVQVTIVVVVFVLLGTLLLQRNGFRMRADQETSAQPSTPPFTPSPSGSSDSGTPSPAVSAVPWLPQSKQSKSFEPSEPSEPSASSDPIYNVQQPAQLPHRADLQAIVDDVMARVERRQLPPEAISVHLIDVKSGASAAYQDEVLRFPASISKLFWMVELYAWIENGQLPAEYGQYDLSTCQTDICRMMQHSDNEAASRIIDAITQTTSGQRLTGEAFATWLNQRKALNRFYQQAGYNGIDISQKNFPIPYLRLDRPTGADLSMRGNPAQPIRNQVSAAQAARLMYEIATMQAVSPIASQHMMQLLTRHDLQTGEWRNEEYNSIEGFFGESLPPEVYLASKVGWTSESRHEVAYVDTGDGRATYILVIFAEDPAYGADWEIFPEISRLVFDRMTD